MRVISLDKDYVYELYQGNNPGEYSIDFPQLAMWFDLTKEDGFYKRQITPEQKTAINDSLLEKIETDIPKKKNESDEDLNKRRLEYGKSKEIHLLNKQMHEEQGVLQKYKIFVRRGDQYYAILWDVLTLIDKIEIKDAIDVVRLNIELVD
jgi:hypothetical protein